MKGIAHDNCISVETRWRAMRDRVDQAIVDTKAGLTTLNIAIMFGIEYGYAKALAQSLYDRKRISCSSRSWDGFNPAIWTSCRCRL